MNKLIKYTTTVITVTLLSLSLSACGKTEGQKLMDKIDSYSIDELKGITADEYDEIVNKLTAEEYNDLITKRLTKEEYRAFIDQRLNTMSDVAKEAASQIN